MDEDRQNELISRIEDLEDVTLNEEQDKLRDDKSLNNFNH
jgi:hypothetical protein